MSPIYDISYNKLNPQLAAKYQPFINIQKLGSTINGIGINPNVNTKHVSFNAVSKKTSTYTPITNVSNNQSIVYKISSNSPVSTQTEKTTNNILGTSSYLSIPSRNTYFPNNDDGPCVCTINSIDPYCQECEEIIVDDECAFSFFTDPYFVTHKVADKEFVIDNYNMIQLIGETSIVVNFTMTSNQIDKFVAVNVLIKTSNCDSTQHNYSSMEGEVSGSFELPSLSPTYDPYTNEEIQLSYLYITVRTSSCTTILRYGQEPECPPPPTPTPTTTPTETTTTPTPSIDIPL